MSIDLLPNIAWHSLSGRQAPLAVGTDTARRYARGYSPIAGFADPARPDFAALARCCDPGEHIYCGGWSGPAPPGWTIEADSAAHQMTWDGPAPAHDEAHEDALAARRLDARDAPAMLALAELTRPGPFAERTVELGEYWGVFDPAGSGAVATCAPDDDRGRGRDRTADRHAGRLIAMAGERMHAGTLREVSGVCTHPDFQGRGLARHLVERLLRRAIARGEHPFLHVMIDNIQARRLYERMGFRARGTVAVRVLVRTP